MNGSGLTKKSGVMSSCIVAGGLLGALACYTLAVAAPADRPETNFDPILSEMKDAVAQTAEDRVRSDRSGDKLRETCLYERLREMLQALETTQVAKVNWEGASARGDAATASGERQRAQEALTLVRRLRNEADRCIGGQELSRLEHGSAVLVTVESNVPTDDPNAGPAESWAVRPPRLDIPGRAAAASPFQVVR